MNPMRFAAETRGVYRNLLRAARETFHDDRVNQTKFRSLVKGTFESPTLESPFRYKTAPKVVTKCSDPAPPPLQQDNQPEASTSSTLPDAEYLSRLQHWRDVATLLRQNVVQGEALKQEKARREQEEQAAQAEAAEAEDLEGRAWKLRITPNTELGDNATIRSPPKLPTTPFPNRERNRRRRAQKTEGEAAASAEGAAST